MTPDAQRDPREVLTRPAPPPDLTLRYGPHPDHVVDLRFPASGAPTTGDRAPLVVAIHGGFWRAAYDRRHTGPMTTALARAGYAVATPEYRRTGQAGGGWPGTLDDVAAALDTLAGLVGEAAPGRVDLDRVVLLGHSAGGHLALWSAARHRLPATSAWHRVAPIGIRGVVALAGVADLVQASALRLDDRAADDLLGGTPAQVPERYAEADPLGLVQTEIPVTLVHGTDDDRVPVEQSRAYSRAALAAGADLTLHELEGVGHFELIDPLSTAWPTVLAGVEGYAGRR